MAAPLLPVDDALAQLLDPVSRLGDEAVAIGNAVHRVLAQDIVARRTQPPFPASAMDGYAMRAEDVAQVPVRLKVVGQAAAGHRYAGSVAAGETVRIFTGAPVPPGADSILLQEDARALDGGMVEALEQVTKGRHIRAAGLDFVEGDVLIKSGRSLDAGAISLAAAANYADLRVVRRPLVAVLATGDELLAPGSTPGPDQIIASNGYGVAALCAEAGADVLDLGIVPDDRAQMAAAVGRAEAAGAHVIVTLGGASVGDHDLVQEVLTGLGMQLEFWKIAMRPGKPLMVGRLGAMHVLGLPGNPVSSLVCAHLFLKPLLARLGGRNWQPDLRDAILGSDMRENDQRRDYVRAAAFPGSDGLVATPFEIQDSSMLKTLAAANCLIVREPFAPPAKAGDAARLLMIR